MRIEAEADARPPQWAPASPARAAESGPTAARADLDAIVSTLHRLDRRLEQAVAAAEALYGADAASDPYRGLQISRGDVDRLLARGPLGPTLHSQTDGPHDGDTMPLGDGSRLRWLTQTFALSPFDTDVFLIALAPELDLRYERLFGYLQDDVTKKRPSVDLVLNLLCASFASKLAVRDRFSPAAPLFGHHLLHLFDDPSHHAPPLLSKYLKVDDRVVRFLLGSDDLDVRLVPYAQYRGPQRQLADILLLPDVSRRLAALIERARAGRARMVLYLQGPYGVGKQSTAEALCTELATGLLVVDVEQLTRTEGPNVQPAVELLFREALLQGAVLYWKGFDQLLADDRRPWLHAVIAAIERQGGLVLLGGDAAWEPVDALHDVPFVRVEIARPGYAQRVQLWEALLDLSVPVPDEIDPKPLANKFRLTGGQIRDVWATARGFSTWREPSHQQVTMADLYAACRLQSSCKLGGLARKIVPHYVWDDIVLPADRIQQLREICNYVKYRSLVYDDWGFDRKLSLGKGLNVLFAGPSGTGKTMAAEIMAAELGTDLYKIDLSAVVSKYIGETEKNLARIFDEAETSNAILFFDEADALFGKRSEVRDSHDRYANIETSYLLQRMEEYKGVVILATNYRKNMDEAFVRRLHSTVEFPLPEEDDRRRIWERLWPAELPRSDALDLHFMARNCLLPGGNIRNIGLAAAFLAADDGGMLNMTHLVRAMRREYQKVGKVVTEGEFGPYADLLDA